MQGVTTALVAIILLALVWPNLIKNRPQYYGAALAVVLIIIFDALATIISAPVVITLSETGAHAETISHGAFYNFCYFLIAIFQVAAFVLLLLSVGGQSVRELGSEMGKTIDVIRRGGEKETLIIPRTGETPRQRAPEEAPGQRIDLKTDDQGTLPLE